LGKNPGLYRIFAIIEIPFAAMQHRVMLIISALLAGLAACDPTPKPPNNQTLKPVETDKDPRPTVYLEGLYATSSAPGQDVFNLFDRDSTTIWRTQTGAGPDEGIMLYFPNALPLNGVEIVPARDAFKGEPADAVIAYVNGKMSGGARPGETINLNNGELVKSLYLRFAQTGREQTTEREQDGVGVVLNNYPAAASVGIQSIKVYNNKGEELRLAPPKRMAGQVSASSTLAPEAAYSCANLFDARKEFVWCEGAKTTGEGETLQFRFDQPVNITAVEIWNGYQRSDKHFSANGRLRDFTFGATDGPTGTYTLRDTEAGQKIDLSAAAKGQTFTLSVKSIYPGVKYKDLAISDLVFYDGAQPFTLASPLAEKYQTETRTKSAGSPLTAILDRRISNEVTEGDNITVQSLIIRSDGTFVLYLVEAYDDTTTEIVADGNWEIVQTNANTARIKIFGKFNNLSNTLEYYKGNTKKEITKIFNEELTIDAKFVRGKKIVGEFYL
jgi:hypothetical protein